MKDYQEKVCRLEVYEKNQVLDFAALVALSSFVLEWEMQCR